MKKLENSNLNSQISDVSCNTIFSSLKNFALFQPKFKFRISDYFSPKKFRDMRPQKPVKHLRLIFFCKKSKKLLPVNHFCKKAPPEMFNRVSNTPLKVLTYW